MRLALDSTMIVCGASKCGKTTFTNKLLENYHLHFNPIPERIIWFYGEIKPSKTLPNVSYELFTEEKLNDITEKSVIVLDDLMMETSKSDKFTNLFTRISHHRKCFIIFITQNLFHASKNNRTRNLSTHYLVLFKNPRDLIQIEVLQRQTGLKFLKAAFDDATENQAYAYLLLDFQAFTPCFLRVRTGILSDETHIVYTNKQSQC